jgi:hypothetical protein
MANTHKHSPWRKSVLIPFWTLQLLLEFLMIALFALAIDVLVNYFNGDETINNSDSTLTNLDSLSTRAEM